MGEFSFGFADESTPSRGIQEFYRQQGFRQGEEQGARNERERIIKLLEEAIEGEHLCESCDEWALIKGENK